MHTIARGEDNNEPRKWAILAIGVMHGMRMDDGLMRFLLLLSLLRASKVLGTLESNHTMTQQSGLSVSKTCFPAGKKGCTG